MKLDPRSIPYRVLARGVKVGWAIVLALAVGSGQSLAAFWPIISAGVVLLLAAGFAYEYRYYQRFAYELTDETVDITSGVFGRRAREIPYRRVQNVDITQNVAQRILGIATVQLETAGGESTEATLECVSAAEAERLQSEIRRLKADRPEAGIDDTQTTVLYELDDRTLLTYSFLSFDPRIASGIAVLFPLLGPLAAGLGLGGLQQTVTTAILMGLIGVGILALVAGIWVASAAVRFVKFYGFRLTRAGDDLQYERGLLKRYTGTIPLEKVQAVSVTENVLMRRVGYATLAVETAGYAPGDAPMGGSEAAVPFAPRGDVVALGQLIEPFDEPTVDRPPRRARRRYAGRYGLLAMGSIAGVFGIDSLIGLPYWWLTFVLVPIAFVAGHYRWAHLGHSEQDEHAITRAGFWSRSTTIVPYYRLQTVVESRSIFQRRWGLASVLYDTAGSRQLAGGDAVAHDVEAHSAPTLVSYAIDRLRAVLKLT